DLSRALVGGGDAQRAGPQVAGVRLVRGGGGGRDLLASRAARRGTQLGLPVLLDPRLGVHPERVPAAGLLAGGPGVLLVVDARHRVDPPAAAGAVPAGRRRPRPGAGVAAGRLPRVRSGPDRQRRRRADRKSTRLNSSHVKISYAV